MIIIIKKKLHPKAICVAIVGRRKETSASVSEEVPLWSVCPCLSEGMVVI